MFSGNGDLKSKRVSFLSLWPRPCKEVGCTRDGNRQSVQTHASFTRCLDTNLLIAIPWALVFCLWTFLFSPYYASTPLSLGTSAQTSLLSFISLTVTSSTAISVAWNYTGSNEDALIVLKETHPNYSAWGKSSPVYGCEDPPALGCILFHSFSVEQVKPLELRSMLRCQWKWSVHRNWCLLLGEFTAEVLLLPSSFSLPARALRTESSISNYFIFSPKCVLFEPAGSYKDVLFSFLKKMALLSF